MPRAVLDTNILISALITPRGTPAKVLQSWRAGHFDVVTSQPLLLELREALSRPHLKDRYRLSLSDIRDFVTLFTSAALVVTAPNVTSALLRDPDDLQVLACALALAAVGRVEVRGTAALAVARLRAAGVPATARSTSEA